MTWVLEGFGQMADDIRSQAAQLTDAQLQAFMDKVVGHTMINIVLMRFLRGAGPNGELWISVAPDTKFGGRWSTKYRIRPSGDEVSEDKIRLVDTKSLMNSYRVLFSSADKVEVGPITERPSGGLSNEELAAIFEDKHKNFVTGWDDEALNIMDMEIGEMITRVVMGEDITAINPPMSGA